MPKLDTPAELRLKIKVSEEKVRRLKKDIQREKQRQAKHKEKLKAAIKRARSN